MGWYIMALTNEDLLAISQLLDVKLDARLKPMENRLKRIEIDLLENKVIPRLNTIESCYTDTYNGGSEDITKAINVE